MKKLTLFFAGVTFLLYANFSFGQAQPPNGNFETWTNANKAEHWTSSINIINEVHFMSSSSDVNEGSYAAKIETQSVFGFAVPGICTYGNINVNMASQTADIVGGKPFTDKPTKLTGWYKYVPAGADTMVVMCFLSKYNPITGLNDTVGSGFYIQTQSNASYNMFELDIQYKEFDKDPDTMNVIIMSSGLHATAGTYVLVDNLEFLYGGSSVNGISRIDYYLYPNPSNGIFNISLAKNELTTFTVYNHMGQKVLESNTSELYNIIDLSGFSKGVYLLEISNGKSKQVEKLLLQ